MSTDVTMQELESETAELLPSRETLCVWYPRAHAGSSVTQVNYGIGNTNQNGGFIQVSALNGDFSGNQFGF